MGGVVRHAARTALQLGETSASSSRLSILCRRSEASGPPTAPGISRTLNPASTYTPSDSCAEPIVLFCGSKIEMSPLGKVEMSPFMSDRSLPFPLGSILWLAAEPVKASLRRAQNRRAALTEPAASRNTFFLIRGNGNSWK